MVGVAMPRALGSMFPVASLVRVAEPVVEAAAAGRGVLRAAAERLGWLRTPLGVFLGSRLLIWAVAVYGPEVVGPTPVSRAVASVSPAASATGVKRLRSSR